MHDLSNTITRQPQTIKIVKLNPSLTRVSEGLVHQTQSHLHVTTLYQRQFLHAQFSFINPNISNCIEIRSQHM